MSSTLNAAHPLAPGSAAPPGCEVYGGKIFMIDARGARIPIELVKAADKLRAMTRCERIWPTPRR